MFIGIGKRPVLVEYEPWVNSLLVILLAKSFTLIAIQLTAASNIINKHYENLLSA
jgi:hypothetical protein